jgi:dTDP-4-dehydrorhamnose 3,5-epimerase
VKLVRCIRGRVFDVIVDLRPSSPTFRRWYGAELSADNGRLLYVPGECAHGYLTLEDGTEVMYPVSSPYAPAAERGIRFDDPGFDIEWPLDRPFIVSEKDRRWPDYA